MKLKSYLSLFRVTSAWSAMSNIYAGFLIAGGPFFSTRLLAGMLVSSLMIMAGMALNDVADKSRDAHERPGRPIPSGKISYNSALWISVVMQVLAILTAGVIYLPSVIPAALLAYSIYLYNFINKNGFFGPLNMGMCRVLNFVLGLTLGAGQGSFENIFSFKVFFALFSLGLYTHTITYLSRDEVKGNTRERVHWFLGGATLWLAFWFLSLFGMDTGISQIMAFVLLFGLSIYLMAPFVELLKAPDGENSQKSITAMLLLMPLLDTLAMLLNGVNTGLSLIGLCFIPLAYITGKYVKIT